MKNRTITIFVTSLIVGSVTLRLHTVQAATPTASNQPSKKPVGKKTAAQLLSDAQKALAATIKEARAAGKELDQTNPNAKPFYQSLKKIGSALDEANAGLKAKDKKFFEGLFNAKVAVAELSPTWDLTKSKNAGVIDGAKKLSGAVTALEDGYGSLASRQAKGGELTDKEKQKFAAMKKQQSALASKVKQLAAKVKGDPSLKAGLKDILNKSQRLSGAPETLNAFTEMGGLIATIEGLLSGYSYYVQPSQRAEWVAVNKVREKLPRFSTYEWATYDWDITSSPVEVYDNLSVSISESEVSSMESFVEDSSFEMTEEEESEVATESDSISEEEAENDEMESEQEEAEDQQEAEDMNDDGDDSASDDAGDDGAGDDGAGAGDDGAGDDGGGDDGGGDE
ncbi:MAG: hypothetical protein WCG66_13060 [bacterium]